MFAPDNWLDRFRLLQVKNLYRVWVAIAFWISFSVVAVDLFSKLGKYIAQRLKWKRNLKIYIKNLINLSTTEKHILKLIYDNDSYSLPYTSASVCKIEAMHMVIRPNLSKSGVKFSYSLQPWVREYLNKHPSFFDDCN